MTRLRTDRPQWTADARPRGLKAGALSGGISTLVVASNLRKAGQTVEGTHSLRETSRS
jgi:hypothetical protein